MDALGPKLRRAVFKEAMATGENPGVVAAALTMVVAEHFRFDEFSQFPTA
jgi:hypothetical protein